jgi:polysaccharide deacetylase family protein (PEP-CTERM system associated)
MPDSGEFYKLEISNFVTFDIEEWYHANYDDQSGVGWVGSSNLFANVESLLDLCDEHKVRSTCFVLGCVARDKPEVVRLILDRGHEIAAHGFNHDLLTHMTPDEFRDDIVRTKDTLEDITGVEVRGYRAPSWSVTEENIVWFYDILAKAGYIYSSSVYPGRTHLFGIPNFPSFPHFPDIGERKAPILEIPHAMTKVLGKRIAFSGGFFLRLLPTKLIRRNIVRINESGLPVFIYLHPREIDTESPHLKLSLVNQFIHYYNIANARDKLSKVMSGHKFILMKEYVVPPLGLHAHNHRVTDTSLTND